MFALHEPWEGRVPPRPTLFRENWRGWNRALCTTKGSTPLRTFSIVTALLLHLLLCSAVAGPAPASAADPFILRSHAQVTSQGVFLSDILEPNPAIPWPVIRLADAPGWGQATTLSRPQVLAALLTNAPGRATAEATGQGPSQVRITRRARPLAETEVKQMLTAALQREHVQTKGELELRLLRSWSTVSVPDEPLHLRVLNLPTTGISASFIARFELSAGAESIGAWQVALQARIWREIWVARTPLARGQLWNEADLVRERRDVLPLRDVLPAELDPASPLELAEYIPAGMALSSRSVRLRAVVRRGQVVEAIWQEGALMVSLKAEALENGAPGQVVRVRNLQSRREFRGKVQNDQPVLVTL